MFSINNARLLICTYLFRENCKYFETLSFQLCWILQIQRDRVAGCDGNTEAFMSLV